MALAKLIGDEPQFDVAFQLWPALALCTSLNLVPFSEQVPELGTWYETTRSQWPSDLLDAVAVLETLHVLMGAVEEQFQQALSDQTVPQFIDWIRDLDAGTWTHVAKSAESKVVETNAGTAVVHGNDLGDPLIVPLEKKARERVAQLRKDHEAARDLLVRTLATCWIEFFRDEYEQWTPELTEARDIGNAAGRRQTYGDFFFSLVGRRPPIGMDLRGVTRMIAVPACHLGPYVFESTLGGATRVLAFDARWSACAARKTDEPIRVSQLKILADETRQKILRFLQHGERYGNEIAEHCGISQPTASQHLRQMVAEGLLLVRKDGGTRHYSIHRETLRRISQAIGGLAKE